MVRETLMTISSVFAYFFIAGDRRCHYEVTNINRKTRRPKIIAPLISAGGDIYQTGRINHNLSKLAKRTVIETAARLL